MADVIAVIVIVGLVLGASIYIYREKKKGSHCIGCPMAADCAKAKAARACAGTGAVRKTAVPVQADHGPQ